MNVDVDRARLAGVVVAPHPLEQLLAAEHLTGIADQEREQLERLWLDGQRLAVAQDLVASQIHSNPSEIDRAHGCPRLRLLFGPPQQGADAGLELAQAEGLGDVIVGAELEAEHLVQLAVPRGEHQDRAPTIRRG